jgi:hypothetical protein
MYIYIYIYIFIYLFLSQKKWQRLGMVVQACDSSTQEVEAREWRVKASLGYIDPVF